MINITVRLIGLTLAMAAFIITGCSGLGSETDNTSQDATSSVPTSSVPTSSVPTSSDNISLIAPLREDLTVSKGNTRLMFTRYTTQNYIDSERVTHTAAIGIPAFRPGLAVLNNCMTIGDSITYVGEYAVTLANMFGTNAIASRGVGGNSLVQMDARYKIDIEIYRPKGVIIFGGINDLVYATTDPTNIMKSAILSLISKAKASGALPIVGDVVPVGSLSSWNANRQSWLEKYNAWLKYYCNTNDVPFFSAYDTLRDGINLSAGFDTGDGLHPNEAGHTALAQAITSALYGKLNDYGYYSGTGTKLLFSTDQVINAMQGTLLVTVNNYELSPADTQIIDSYPSNPSALTRFNIGLFNSGIYFGFGTGLGLEQISVGTINTLHEMRIAVSWDETERVRVYINGMERGVSHSSPKFTVGDIMGVGSMTNGANPLNGTISNLTIYKTALSHNQCISLTK